MKFENSKGIVYYGMHFYPGLAEYAPEGRDPFRVFINEDTIRSMDKSFTGRPVYVDHVDGVPPSLDQLHKTVDGYVVKSFYNASDGKHWVQFIVCSEKGEAAIKAGAKLSNCYIPRAFGPGGEWNGMSYVKEITAADYEHLALVSNPRYNESLVLTEEQFKAYNSKKDIELERLANQGKGKTMGFSLFKRKTEKIENSADYEGLHVVLPTSKREISFTALVNEADLAEAAKGKPRVCNGTDMVEMGDKKQMCVADLLDRHKAMNDELEAFKKKAVNTDDDDATMNEETEEEKKKKKEKEEEDEKTKNALEAKKKADDEATAAKKAADKVAADRLKNASNRTAVKAHVVELDCDRVARGKELF